MAGGRAAYSRTPSSRVLAARTAVAIVVLAALLAAGPTSRPRPGTAPPPKPGTVARHFRVALHSACDGPHRARFVYHWPVRPFDRQHPIRGNFGDPRTLVGESIFGADTPRSPGSYTFHNGIDIVARTGTPVYPVVSGLAQIGYADEVIVATGDGRRFQYFHIRPAVRPGQRVFADRTVLGHVLPHWLHVHLSEIDGFRIHNPLDPGHLEPYQDHTVPLVEELIVTDELGRELDRAKRRREPDPRELTGRVLLSAAASDAPPLPVPGAWFGFPVTPALVTWRVETLQGQAVEHGIAADFRHTEPPNRDFWRVYAAGTYQNFPVFGTHYFYRRAGHYVFNLTRFPLDTTRLPNGEYVVVVRAADVCGNVGSLREWVLIRN